LRLTSHVAACLTLWAWLNCVCCLPRKSLWLWLLSDCDFGVNLECCAVGRRPAELGTGRPRYMAPLPTPSCDSPLLRRRTTLFHSLRESSKAVMHRRAHDAIFGEIPFSRFPGRLIGLPACALSYASVDLFRSNSRESEIAPPTCICPGIRKCCAAGNYLASPTGWSA